jgi:hypothetical protein
MCDTAELLVVRIDADTVGKLFHRAGIRRPVDKARAIRLLQGLFRHDLEEAVRELADELLPSVRSQLPVLVPLDFSVVVSARRGPDGEVCVETVAETNEEK